MNRLPILIVAVAATLALWPAACLAKGAGDPWAGSYMRINSFPEWVNSPDLSFEMEYSGLFDTEVDGAANPDQEDVALVAPWLSGTLASGAGVLHPDHLGANMKDNGYWTCYADGRMTVELSAGDGEKNVSLRFEALGATEDYKPRHPFSPTYSESTILDTHGAKTVAPYALTCKPGGYVTITYQVVDLLSPTLTVSIRITSSSGKTVKSIALGTQPNKTVLTSLWKCGLGKGKYRYSVLATDLAGNKASKIGRNSLTVR